MRRILVLAIMALLAPLPAQASGEWFAILYGSDQVGVIGDKGNLTNTMTGMSIDECVKVQLTFEKRIEKASGEEQEQLHGSKVRCSLMQQKVRSVNQDDALDRTYRVTWVADFVRFTEVTSLKQCQQQKSALDQYGGADLFFCAQSTQLIK